MEKGVGKMTSLLKQKLLSCSKISLDTNVFIYIFEGRNKFFLDVKDLLKFIEEKKLNLYVSIFVYLEILSNPLLTDRQTDLYTRFFEENKLFDLQDVNINVARRAAFLRRKYRIKAPDAIILASAIESGVELFITADVRLQQVEEIEVFVLK